eukprot:symbB.v1.2.021726.t1/scaffold1895.1/size96826/1
MNQVINGGCHASRNWNAHRSAPQKVQWHGQSDAPIALVPLTKVAESASHFIATTPAQAPSVVPVAKPAEVSAAAKSRDEAPKAEETKKAAATTPQGPVAAPKSKAATMTGGSGVNTLSPASAVTAKATSPPAPPASAAAVMEEGKKPITAAERLAGTGSSLAKGVGAKAEPQAKPKAKAKMSAIPSRPLPRDTLGAAPEAVLNMVSGKPVPAAQAGTSAYATSNVGPARAYAKSAAGAVSGEVPKAGPPAVAMGRALAAGRPAMQMVNGKPVTTITKKYQLVFVTGEVAPFSKTGGLGEAMDGLPIALAALGHRCMVISPRYDQYAEAWDTGYWGSVTMGGKQESVHFFHSYKQKVDYVFVDHPTFLERVNGMTGSKLYGPEWGKDFADNQARFAYFCKAALKAIQELPLGGASYGGDCMVVCNDWHSALVPMLIHAEKTMSGKWQNTKTAFLCHNAVFQGRFVREEGLAGIFGVPERYIDSITFKMPLRIGKYNEKITCVNTMAAGLKYCDRALTVSPSYAVECCTDPEKGVELESLFTLGKCTGTWEAFGMSNMFE